jgi:hypothetical protein
MVAITRADYDTCIYCGEPVRHLTTSTALGKLRSRSTRHVREVRDASKRCRYDAGPEPGSLALASFPGDT